MKLSFVVLDDLLARVARLAPLGEALGADAHLVELARTACSQQRENTHGELKAR
jgi:hypothetical protein